MTAEIVVMNKLAIALAADSAVTISAPGGSEPKIYNTVNKLFSLSKYQPMGVMVYGDAEFMAVPWETIIKTYRSRLGRKRFGTAEDYSKDFISFFEEKNGLFPEAQQDEYFASRVAFTFYRIRQRISQAVEDKTKQSGSVSTAEIEQITSETIADYHAELQKVESLPNFSDSDLQVLRARYEDTIGRRLEKVYEKLVIADSSLAQLREIATLLFSKIDFDYGYSGVVIAGFGELETFPSVHAYEFEGVLLNRPRFRKNISKSDTVTYDTPAVIIPFAQSDMVHTFMEGVEPRYQEFVHRAALFLLRKFTDSVVGHIPKLDDSEKESLGEWLKGQRLEALKLFSEMLRRYRSENCSEAIISAVESLPKNELASMAESLVNLTVFKRRMSLTPETVGGPIDVAVITKGDGLIWIKRKHYFKPDLNAQFFANYYRKDETDPNGN